MADEEKFVLTLTLDRDYRFEADFGLPGVSDLVLDEPVPLGGGEGPNAARLLAAAIGNCLAASLAHCLRKSRLDLRGLEAVVEGSLVRNERGRLRIGGIHVRLEPELEAAEPGRFARCLEIFEDFCIVTESVRRGIDVSVDVRAPTEEAAPALG